MPSSDVEAQIAEIQTELLKRCDALGTIVADTIWREVDYYGDTGQVGKDQLTADLRTSLRQIFEALNAATPYSIEQPTGVGEARARVGIPLPAMLEAYGISGRLARHEVADLATARPDLSREAFMRVFERLWLAQDAYTHAMADAYRDTMSRKVLNQAAERAALAEALIDGRIVEQADLWEIAQILKLPARGPYVAVAAECASLGRSALVGIEAKLDSLGIASAWRLLPDVQLGLVHVRDDAMLDVLKGVLARLAVNRVGISSPFDDLRNTPRGVKYARIALSVEPRDGSLITTFQATPLSIAAVSAPDVMKQVSATVLAGFTAVEEREREVLFDTFRGVPAACLHLQSRHDVDVPMLLFAAFVGAVRRQTLTASDVDVARERVDAWHHEVVRPLRAVRQRLKTGPAPAPNDRTARLRSEVQRIEIEAELIELDELDALIPELDLMSGSGSATECAATAIETVVKAYSIASLDDRDLWAVDTVAGAASGSAGVLDVR